MKMNKCVLSLFALTILVAPQTLLHASPVLPTLNVNGSAVVLTQSVIAGVDEFAYTNVSTDVLNTRTTTFLATFADVAGVDVLNITDVCAQVTLLGPGVPCQALAFSFTDISGWNASLISALGTAHASVAGDVASINFDASIGAGSGTFNFNPSPAPTPEPESLALLATGLMGMAGVIRRKAASTL